MASELQLAHTPGQTVYAIIRNAAGQVWNGSTFVSQNNSNWGTYAVALTETPANGGFYVGNFPAVAGGAYSVVAYQQAGGSPAVTDSRIGVGSVAWSGTAAVRDGEMTRRLAQMMEEVT